MNYHLLIKIHVRIYGEPYAHKFCAVDILWNIACRQAISPLAKFQQVLGRCFMIQRVILIFIKCLSANQNHLFYMKVWYWFLSNVSQPIRIKYFTWKYNNSERNLIIVAYSEFLSVCKNLGAMLGGKGQEDKRGWDKTMYTFDDAYWYTVQWFLLCVGVITPIFSAIVIFFKIYFIMIRW